MHLAHYWSKHIRLNSQSSVTSAEQTVPSLGKVSVLETNAFECSLCTEMENYRIKMCNCKGNKMRKETSKNRNIYKYIYIYSNFLSLTGIDKHILEQPMVFPLAHRAGSQRPKIHSSAFHPASILSKPQRHVMISQCLFLFFSYGENGVTNHDNIKYKNSLVASTNALVENTFHH